MSERAREMIARLDRDWREAGLSPADRGRLVRRAGEVMADRAVRIPDEHHPAFLHPLRTVLLLLEASETDPRAHETALVVDSERPGTAEDPQGREPSEDREDGSASGPAPEALEVFGAPHAERLERLVVAAPWVRRTWLAERLDHLRHLHLWAGPERTRTALDRAEEEEAPLAAREGGRLHRAWADWMDKARRFGLAERAETRPIDG